jgi:diguanylate cyclase (GGDEF)-like protein
VPGARARVSWRTAGAVVALAAYAVAWVAPPGLRPSFAALAVILASVMGRGAGVVAAVATLLLPMALPVRIALAGAALVNGELHERRRARSKALASRSFTDRLTGLHNYDFFVEAMRAELARVRRYGGCVTLVLVDLDHFKQFNDRHGHAAGNTLLASVGRAVTREKRDADIAARFGGEEFALVVSGRSRDGVVLAERLRAAIADLSPAPSLRGLDGGVTASAGVATFPVDARNPRELFELADRALYEAKRRGRDQVVTAAELLEPALRMAR